MITIIEQPAAWIAAYDSNRFEFQYSQSVGLFTVTDNLAGTHRVIQAGAGVSMFYAGQYVQVTISGTPYFTKVLSTDIGTGDVTLELPAGLSSTPNCDVVVYWDDPVEVILEAGNTAVGIPFAEVAKINVVCRASVYAIDVLGYLQDYFKNIQKPPVVGIDKELFCHYRLKLNDGALFPLGSVKSCAYSTIENLNASAYVATAGTPLRVGAVEVFNGEQSIYSRIVGNYILTNLI